MSRISVGDSVVYNGPRVSCEGQTVLDGGYICQVLEIKGGGLISVRVNLTGKGVATHVDAVTKISAMDRKNEFHSSHYESDSIEPITYIMSNHLSFNRGNIVKYAARAGKKAGQQALDCHKIIDYTMLMAIEEGIELNEEELIKLIRYRFDWNKSKGRG